MPVRKTEIFHKNSEKDLLILPPIGFYSLYLINGQITIYDHLGNIIDQNFSGSSGGGGGGTTSYITSANFSYFNDLLTINQVTGGTVTVSGFTGALISSINAPSTTTVNVDKRTIFPIDCTANAISLNLSFTPANGDFFSIVDSYNNCKINNITLAGQKFYGAVQDFIVDINGSFVTFQYINSTVGWIVKT
jgi:hypothetical protein